MFKMAPDVDLFTSQGPRWQTWSTGSYRLASRYNYLNNISARHEFTRETPTSDAAENFANGQRYPSTVCYGILIDTGAAENQ